MNSIVKRIFVLLCSFFLLCLCSCNDHSRSTIDDYFQVNYQIDYSDITEDIAKQIAYNTLVDELQLSPENYTIVNSSINQNVWLISFLVDEDACGGSVNIEICAETGKVLSFNGGE